MSIDFLLFLVQTLIFFFAYLLYLQELLSDNLIEYMVSYHNIYFIALYLGKFALDILLYKALGGNNSKRLTPTLFYMRVSFDTLAIASTLLY